MGKQPVGLVFLLLFATVVPVSSLVPSIVKRHTGPPIRVHQCPIKPPCINGGALGQAYDARSRQCSAFVGASCVFQKSPAAPETNTLLTGTVLRTALRKYDRQHSKPSDANYTTRKDEQPDGIEVTKAGIKGDYNHYRTLALNSTPDRAVSLWTTDVLPLLHSASYPVDVGDLGENLSLEGVPFDYFRVGKRYKFASADDGSTMAIIEITERTEPCANLCKLPYINEAKLEPKQRIQKCLNFIELLNQADGLRGWYAKVIQEGFIRPGDMVVMLEEDVG